MEGAQTEAIAAHLCPGARSRLQRPDLRRPPGSGKVGRRVEALFSGCINAAYGIEGTRRSNPTAKPETTQ